MLRLGLTVAAIVCALDQALKLWLIFAFDLGSRGLEPIAPGVDLVLTWNEGISYGLFPQASRWLLIAVKVIAAILLTIWLSRTQNRLTALALGLIIGGAVGNAIDRLVHHSVILEIDRKSVRAEDAQKRNETRKSKEDGA